MPPTARSLNAPQLLPPIPTFPTPVQRRSRAAFLAAPRWAPAESFPPDQFRPLLRSGNGKLLTVISSGAGDMFPAPVFGQSSLRTNARRGASNAPQLLPPIPTFSAPVHGKSRAAFLAAPRWAPVESFPPERFRPSLRLGNGNPLTVIPSVAGDVFPAPVYGKPSAGRTSVAAH
ncbi:MAG: hypothetical protein IPN90_12035 [Elusimicrobia bacterium]|nr:hypothetical protein [Elusimicrobiota bacterium]